MTKLFDGETGEEIKPQCSCCQMEGGGELRRVSPMMDPSAQPLGSPVKETDRWICSQCFGIWYEECVTNPAAIGAIALQRRAEASLAQMSVGFCAELALGALKPVEPAG